jgi:hypothetical protein
VRCSAKLFPAGFAALTNIAMAGFAALEKSLTLPELMKALCAVVVVCVYVVSFDHRVDIAFFSFDPSECECMPAFF